jgi:hypothetical protein
MLRFAHNVIADKQTSFVVVRQRKDQNSADEANYQGEQNGISSGVREFGTDVCETKDIEEFKCTSRHPELQVKVSLKIITAERKPTKVVIRLEYPKPEIIRFPKDPTAFGMLIRKFRRNMIHVFGSVNASMNCSFLKVLL